MSSVWSTEQTNPFIEGNSQNPVRTTRDSRGRGRRLTEAHEDPVTLSPRHAITSPNNSIQFGNLHPGDERLEHPDLSALPEHFPETEGERIISMPDPPMTQDELSQNVSSFKARAPSPTHREPNFAASFNFRPSPRKEKGKKVEPTIPARLARLTPVGKPLLQGVPEQSEGIVTTNLKVPTLRMPFVIPQDIDITMDELLRRYSAVIEHGEKSLGRYLPKEQNGRRKELEEEPLGSLGTRLNQLLSEVDTIELSNGERAYRVNGRKWRHLIEGLREAKELCKEIFENAKKESPTVPVWGRDGEYTDFWSLNDFEILAVAARCDIENFMLKIRDIVFWEHQRREEIVSKGEDAKDHQELASRGKSSETRKSEHALPSIKQEAISEVPIERETRSAPTMIKVKKESEEEGVRHKNPFKKDMKNSEFTSRSVTPQLNRKVEFLQPTGTVPRESSSTVFQTLFNPTFPQLEGETDIKSKATGRTAPYGSVRFSDSPDGSDSSSSESDSDQGNFGGGRRGNRRPRRKEERKGRRREEDGSEEVRDEPKFDHRLKADVIPVWDGNTDELARWIVKVNSLASLSRTVWKQLGHLVPTRLKGSAERWYYSQHPLLRRSLEENWDTLRKGISEYYMNRSYLDKQKVRANRATYRDASHAKELPSEYFIRKLELLQQVYDYNERELISEIMSGAPSLWIPILTPHLYHSVADLQTALKFHEDVLLQHEAPRFGFSRNPFNTYRAATPARVNQVGWSEAVKNPAFPKDDANVSKRGTPVSKGGRPCRHCGSGNHWDYECKYSRKGERRVRTNLAIISEEDYKAQEEYDDLYYNLESEGEEVTDF